MELGLVGKQRGPYRSYPHNKGSDLFKKKRKTRLLSVCKSIVLEKAFWDAINVILLHEYIALQDFSQMAQERRRSSSLTASLRLITLLYFQSIPKI